MKVKGYVGYLFLSALIVNSVLTVFLYRLGDDAEDVIKYIILVFVCSILSSGVTIFNQTTDQNNRASNPHQLILINSLNLSLMQFSQMIEMLISGIVMESNLHNLFIFYGVLTGISIPLHILRIIKYPDSFESNSN